MASCRPSGVSARARSVTRGLRPWLLTVAASRLRIGRSAIVAFRSAKAATFAERKATNVDPIWFISSSSFRSPRLLTEVLGAALGSADSAVTAAGSTVV